MSKPNVFEPTHRLAVGTLLHCLLLATPLAWLTACSADDGGELNAGSGGMESIADTPSEATSTTGTSAESTGASDGEDGSSTQADSTDGGSSGDAECAACASWVYQNEDRALLCEQSAALSQEYLNCVCADATGCEEDCGSVCHGGAALDNNCLFCAFECVVEFTACTDVVDTACVDDGTCNPGTEDCSCADCSELASCDGQQCVQDGKCTLEDACTCADCSAGNGCPDVCNLDGECQSFFEGCSCADCTEEPNCAA